MANYDVHICSGGIASIPDLRNEDSPCYKDNRTPKDQLVITQYPEPGTLVSSGQHMITVLTEDGDGNATECVHYFNVSGDNPAPSIACVANFSTWLIGGQYIMPDFTGGVVVTGGCTLKDDMSITQSPAANTVLTTAGAHVITMSVSDAFGHVAECSFTITLKSPSGVQGESGGGVVPPPPPPPPEIPSYIYAMNLLAYWPFNDLGFLLDLSVLIGNTSPRNLSNAGGATALEQSIRPPGGQRPGPNFDYGSLFANRLVNAWTYRDDDTNLRLLNKNWTIRFGFRLMQKDHGNTVQIITKAGVFANGYRIGVLRSAGDYYLVVQLASHAGFGMQSPYTVLSINSWTAITITFNDTTGTLNVYKDGMLDSTTASPGFHIGGDVDALRLGAGNDGTGIEAYLDEVGIWTEEWNAARVLDDYNLLIT